MKIPTRASLIVQMIQSRVSQFVAQGPTLAASLVEIAKHCGREGCHCQTGSKHVGHYLTLKVAGKTKTVYVPLDLLEEVRSWIKEHKRLKELASEISQLSIARVRGYAQDQKRRQGRP
ncbi:MAG TPA: DUF6788 family protein [Candidatus Methylomirabilis sp.]|nr:DUF6788 family protein [Candidatus Methylomirabilis sp.]